MGEAQIRVFSDMATLSRALAEHVAARAMERAREGRRFSVALSGGHTPRPLYERLACEPLASRIPWPSLDLFQVDERAVPPDDPQSNYRMIRQSLLDRVALAAANFHRMEAERANLDAAAEHYEQLLAERLVPAVGHPPRFDLILLGLGPDGHTASLFPGTRALAEQTRWVVPNFVSKLNAYRMTLTYPVLNAAGEIVFMVSGEEKRDILRQALEGQRDPEQWPAQAVQPVAGHVVWFVDKAAAGGLASARVKTS